MNQGPLNFRLTIPEFAPTEAGRAEGGGSRGAPPHDS